MAKGDWIVQVDVTDPRHYREYAASTGDAPKRYGGRFLIRAGERTVVEGGSRTRNVLVEFPSYRDALDCWYSPEYPAARELRLSAASVDLVIIEGGDAGGRTRSDSVLNRTPRERELASNGAGVRRERPWPGMRFAWLDGRRGGDDPVAFPSARVARTCLPGSGPGTREITRAR